MNEHPRKTNERQYFSQGCILSLLFINYLYGKCAIRGHLREEKKDLSLRFFGFILGSIVLKN